MGVTRRTVVGMLTAVAATPVMLVLRRLPCVPRCAVEAVRSVAYPGRVRPLDPEHVARAARWAG